MSLKFSKASNYFSHLVSTMVRRKLLLLSVPFIFFLSFQNQWLSNYRGKRYFDGNLSVKNGAGLLIIGEFRGRIGVFFLKNSQDPKNPKSLIDSMIVFQGKETGSAGFSIKKKLVFQASSNVSEFALIERKIRQANSKGISLGFKVDKGMPSLLIQKFSNKTKISNSFYISLTKDGGFVRNEGLGCLSRFDIERGSAIGELFFAHRENNSYSLRYGVSHFSSFYNCLMVETQEALNGFGVLINKAFSGLYKFKKSLQDDQIRGVFGKRNG